MADNISPFQACRKCTCSALRRASRAVTQHYEASFRGTGLRATQFTLLATLAQTGPQPLNALATMLGLERTTLSRNLAPLEKKGYISRTTDMDQRIRRISITPEGETAALMALDAWKQAQSTVEKLLEELEVPDLKILRSG
ncbi:MAG TPA: MarR family transcriptional regulator [Burkholderiales bacterium]|nr:MarR family transcriptional regulator [Burkholderiales bacterium]